MFLYDISASMLHFIFYFSYEFGRFYALFYNDVRTLLWRHSFFDRSQWKLHSICKIENKRHFVCENILIFGIFIEKITINYENHVSCPVPLYLPPPPSPLGRPLAWVLLGTHLWQTWGYFLNTKKKKNSFYLNWWKPGSIPGFQRPPPNGGPLAPH